MENYIPGKFVVDFDDTIFYAKYSQEELQFYSNLNLELFPDHKFRFNKLIDTRGMEGKWEYTGRKMQKHIYLNFNDNLQIQIGACSDTGDFFSYLMHSLDADGKVRHMKFRKIENYR